MVTKIWWKDLWISALSCDAWNRCRYFYVEYERLASFCYHMFLNFIYDWIMQTSPRDFCPFKFPVLNLCVLCFFSLFSMCLILLWSFELILDLSLTFVQVKKIQSLKVHTSFLSSAKPVSLWLSSIFMILFSDL